MDLSLFKFYQILGLPPRYWMIPNPMKIYEFVEVTKSSGLNKDHMVLDLGCGKGHWSLALAKKAKNVIGIDTSETQIAIARRFLRNSSFKNRVQFFCGRLEEVHLSSESMDRIFSFCVLEHIPELDEVLSDIFRILKPGGELHVSVDSLANIAPEISTEHKRQHYVHQYFTPNSLQQQFQKSGFEILEIYPILTTQFAVTEFEKRIHGRFRNEALKRIFGNYKYGLLKRFLIYKQFQQGDTASKDPRGIMLIGRARRP